MSFPSSDSAYRAFTTVLDLDRFAPGLIGKVLRGSPTRRQGICATLSVHHTTRLSDQQKSDLARELRFAKGKVLIAEAAAGAEGSEEPRGLAGNRRRDCRHSRTAGRLLPRL